MSPTTAVRVAVPHVSVYVADWEMVMLAVCGEVTLVRLTEGPERLQPPDGRLVPAQVKVTGVAVFLRTRVGLAVRESSVGALMITSPVPLGLEQVSAYVPSPVAAALPVCDPPAEKPPGPDTEPLPAGQHQETVLGKEAELDLISQVAEQEEPAVPTPVVQACAPTVTTPPPEAQLLVVPPGPVAFMV
jgi:hypothetical protein